MFPVPSVETFTPEMRNYFTHNVFRVNQSTIRKLFVEMIDYCKELLVPCNKLLGQKVKEPEKVDIKLAPARLFMLQEIRRLQKNFIQETTDALERRIEILTDLIAICSTYLNCNSELKVIPCKDFLNVPIETILADATARTRNRIRSLKTLLLSTHIFVVPRSNSDEISKLIKFLQQISDNETLWYPRCDASERFCAFISKYYTFDFTDNHSILSSITKTTNEILAMSELPEDYFPTVYFSVYRTAFDLSYPQFIYSECENTNIFIHDRSREFPARTQEQLNQIQEILLYILFETNPIDIGFHMSKVLTLVAIIANLIRAEQGQSFSAFISADEIIELLQSIIYMNNFTYVVNIMKVIETFCTHPDYPYHFQYSCQSFRIATIDLMK